MQTRRTPHASLLIWALPLGGLLFVAGILGRGPSLDPSVDATRFAQAATAPNAALAWLAIVAGMVVTIVGTTALYVRLSERTAGALPFWAMVLNVAGMALTLPLIGFMAWAAPVVGEQYLRGQQDAIQVALPLFRSSSSLAALFVSGIAYTVGSILFARALSRAGLAPRWIAVCFALQAPLVSIAATFSFTAELVGAVLLLVSGGWVALQAARPVPSVPGATLAPQYP